MQPAAPPLFFSQFHFFFPPPLPLPWVIGLIESGDKMRINREQHFPPFFSFLRASSFLSLVGSISIKGERSRIAGFFLLFFSP